MEIYTIILMSILFLLKKMLKLNVKYMDHFIKLHQSTFWVGDVQNVKDLERLKEAKRLFPNDKLDRSFLASQIFNNQEAMSFVNSVMHPAVAERFIEWSERLVDLLPSNYIKIEMFLVDDRRTIKVKKVIQ